MPLTYAMKTLFFDCFAGASGNMILAGLVSLGIDSDELIKEIGKLNIVDFDVKFSAVNRSGIAAIHAETKYSEERKHRFISDIEEIIENSDLSDSVKFRSKQIFGKLALAEAKVHGVDSSKVHFHEVGAMDAIIDVVGACIGFEMMGFEQFACSKIHVGSGFVDIAHGKYPVPPPAVAELLKGFSVYSTEIKGELMTPTGAAIIATVCQDSLVFSAFQTEKIGYGAGTREYANFPNVLRLMIGNVLPQRRESAADDVIAKQQNRNLNTENLLLIETNLDDISSEVLGFLMERAFDLGALDCWFTPIQMKKNRPATTISILCSLDEKDRFSDLLYSETTTLGIRISQIMRECLPREIRKVTTEFGEIDVKIARYRDRIVNVKPEYEQIRQISIETKHSFREIEKIVLRNFEDSDEEKVVGRK